MIISSCCEEEPAERGIARYAFAHIAVPILMKYETTSQTRRCCARCQTPSPVSMCLYCRIDQDHMSLRDQRTERNASLYAELKLGISTCLHWHEAEDDSRIHD